jgi:SPP1 family predicted phage head-tail adaptor
VSIGSLREYITIETPTEVDDGQGTGGFTVSWSTFSTAWAQIKPWKSFTMRGADNNEHKITHRIRVRELAGISQKMRVSFEGRIFHIHGFYDPGERDRFTDMLCEEGDGVAS